MSIIFVGIRYEYVKNVKLDIIITVFQTLSYVWQTNSFPKLNNVIFIFQTFFSW